MNTIKNEFSNLVKSPTSVFDKQIVGVGDFYLRPLQIKSDVYVVHEWVTQEYAKFWGMQDNSLEEVESKYLEICSHSKAFLGFFNNKPSFLLEQYCVANDLLKDYYEVEKGDYGMHILVSPAKNPIPRFTWHVFTVIMDFMFADVEVQRIVVEPDICNEKIHVLNKRAGFEYEKVLHLPHKTAHLAFCTPEQYFNALIKESL